MSDRNLRPRTLIVGVIASFVALILVAFSGPVGAQDSPRIGVKVRSLSAELRKQRNLSEDVKGGPPLADAIDGEQPL